MEAGKRAASDGDEQEREDVLARCGQGGKGVTVNDHGGGHGCLAGSAQNHNANHRASDHNQHHDAGKVVARLLKRLDGHGSSEDQVHHDDGKPAHLVQVDGELHAHGKHSDHQNNGEGELFSAGEVPLAAAPTKSDGHKGKQHRDGTSGAARIGLGVIDRAAGGIDDGLERTGDHIGERGDNNDAEQPAEQQEQATTRAADVLLDQLGKRLAVVLHRGVQGAKVMHGAKEDAAHQHPQHNGQPAKHHGDDSARNGTRTADRRKLMRERGEAGGRREVLSVHHATRRRQLRVVHAPALGEPAAIHQVASGQNNRSDYDYCNSIHRSSFPQETRPSHKKQGPSIHLDGPCTTHSRPLSRGQAKACVPALANNADNN